MKKNLFLIILGIFVTTFSYAQTVREDILYIKPNAKEYLYYTNLRARGQSFNKIIPKSRNLLEKYLYINPERFRVDNRNKSKTTLEFGTDNYALMSEEIFNESELKVSGNGFFEFDNDTIARRPGRHYGIYTTLRYFKQFAYVWVLPENFEFVEYKCNKPGKWNKRGNTLTYFGYKVNDLLFNIKFRPTSQLTLDNVKSTLYQGNAKNMKVTSNTKGVQINFRRGVLFAGGGTTISELGANILTRLSKTLKTSTKVRLAIEVPVKNGVNAGEWMLAAARGRMMVEEMVKKGISPSRIEVKTYGVKSLQANKGIEIQLINAPKRKQ